jgi:hypothetical protein
MVVVVMGGDPPYLCHHTDEVNECTARAGEDQNLDGDTKEGRVPGGLVRSVVGRHHITLTFRA